ncbi:MAG TPA: hypothetical protein VFB61_09000 [Gemmatimonadales bacterium]|nr:hypothetical protein [Gemmatimonadales bacterium]
MFTQPLLRSFLAAGAAAGLLAACGGDETTGTEDHTPTSYQVLINGVTTTAPFTFTVGQTSRVQLKFFNAAGDDLDDVESSHFGGLTFNPTSMATVARVIGHNYQFDVTGSTEGSGTMTPSFGHDEAADEHTLQSAQAIVASEGGGNPL